MSLNKFRRDLPAMIVEDQSRRLREHDSKGSHCKNMLILKHSFENSLGHGQERLEKWYIIYISEKMILRGKSAE